MPKLDFLSTLKAFQEKIALDIGCLRREAQEMLKAQIEKDIQVLKDKNKLPLIGKIMALVPGKNRKQENKKIEELELMKKELMNPDREDKAYDLQQLQKLAKEGIPHAKNANDMLELLANLLQASDNFFRECGQELASRVPQNKNLIDKMSDFIEIDRQKPLPKDIESQLLLSKVDYPICFVLLNRKSSLEVIEKGIKIVANDIKNSRILCEDVLARISVYSTFTNLSCS